MSDLRFVDPQWREDYVAERLAEFASNCHRRRLPVTPQRLAIIRALLASEEHPTADDIFERLRKQHPRLSRATVHRTLEQFCKVGEARKVTRLHESARYDGNVHPHHHLVCVRCRRVRDVEMPEVDELVRGLTRVGEFTLLACSL